MPLPDVEFTPLFNDDMELARDKMLPLQSIISIYDEHTQLARTITFNAPVLGQMGRNHYVIINSNKSEQVFVAVSFPREFSVQQYEITQIVDVNYQVHDPSFSGSIFRALPSELTPYIEAETSGEPCNQATFGQLTITSEQPVQGNFQFNCQFEDGFYASLAGVFSQ